jgi:hypothetical protein
MFDSKTTLAERLTNAVDLMIDFATLGEYGLEPVGRTTPSCQSRRRPHRSVSGARWREATTPASLSENSVPRASRLAPMFDRG